MLSQYFQSVSLTKNQPPTTNSFFEALKKKANTKMWFRSDLLSQYFQSVSQTKNFTFTKAHSRTLGRTLCPSSFLCLVLASSGSLYTLPVSGLGLSSPVPGLASSSLTLPQHTL
jgi:hypothetical protein